MSEMIRVQDVSKTFAGKDNTVEALKHINLSIGKGEIYGIIGMSGAGKSTLVRCLNFLERPTSGTVYIDGQDLCDLKEAELRRVRRKVAMIFQHFNLLMQRDVLDNVCFPLEIAGMKKKAAGEKAMAYLEEVGLSEKAHAYPAQLSGGQKQRVAIARALAAQPEVLLCDEATSALDPTTTKSILQLLREINEKYGITIVIITHEMAVVEEICTHVAILDHGVLQESGTVEDIFSNPQTEAGRRLVYPNGVVIDQLPAANVIRIAFNGGSSYEPLIASLAIDCGVKVNILGADTRNIDGKAFGTMLLGLPTDPEEAAKAMAYIKSQPNVTMEEVRDYHG